VLILVLREIPDDPDLRDQWDALVFQMHSPQVFYTYEWARAVQLSYGESLRPLLLLARDERQRLVGVAALAAPENGPVSFLCATTGDYCDFVVGDKDAAVFTAQVVQALREQRYRDIALTNLPEDSPCYSALRSAGHGFHVYARTAYVCAQIRLSKVAHDAGKLVLPRQKMVRRSLRAMGGTVTVADADWESVAPLLPDFFRAHVSRFAFTGRVSNLIRPERRKFLAELARLLSPTGWLCLTRVNAGPRTVAWNFGFRFCATLFWYQPAFLNDLEKYSPGFVLLSKLIEDAAQDPGVETVDLGLGAEAYKEAFANASSQTMYVTLRRSRFEHWKETVRFRTAVSIAVWPRAERAARSLIVKAKDLRRRVQRSGLPSTLGWLLSRLVSMIFLREEVFFFEGNMARHEQSELCSLRPMSYDLLADAAMRFHDDEETLQYLLRAAQRMRQENAEGFVLVDTLGALLHFAWASAFDGFFLSELNTKVSAPSTDCVMLFDCWTPLELRGRGHYGQTVRLIAKLLRERGKRPWIFSAGSNRASLRGLAKAGVQPCYSLIRQRILGWQRISGKAPRLGATPCAEVSAQI
jgi:CelD/BcsL family acetyltransferase involved in cellulose biosynthesis